MKTAADPIEGRKLDFEFWKHLTTLATGAILVLAALTDKLFPEPECLFLVAATVVVLMVSVIGSVMLMAATSYEVLKGRNFIENRTLSYIFTIMSLGGFILGLTAFVIFVCLNVL